MSGKFSSPTDGFLNEMLDEEKCKQKRIFC